MKRRRRSLVRPEEQDYLKRRGDDYLAVYTLEVAILSTKQGLSRPTIAIRQLCARHIVPNYVLLVSDAVPLECEISIARIGRVLVYDLPIASRHVATCAKAER